MLYEINIYYRKFCFQINQCFTLQISAEPLDINVLPEYNKDPRVVTNVLDGVNRTRDDVHMWLAPFTTGQHNYLYLTFDKPCKIALMRIWVGITVKLHKSGKLDI